MRLGFALLVDALQNFLLTLAEVFLLVGMRGDKSERSNDVGTFIGCRVVVVLPALGDAGGNNIVLNA